MINRKRICMVGAGALGNWGSVILAAGHPGRLTTFTSRFQMMKTWPEILSARGDAR